MEARPADMQVSPRVRLGRPHTIHGHEPLSDRLEIIRRGTRQFNLDLVHFRIVLRLLNDELLDAYAPASERLMQRF